MYFKTPFSYFFRVNFYYIICFFFVIGYTTIPCFILQKLTSQAEKTQVTCNMGQFIVYVIRTLQAQANNLILPEKKTTQPYLRYE